MIFFEKIFEYCCDFSVQLFLAELVFCSVLKRRSHFFGRIALFAVLFCIVPYALDFYNLPWLSFGWFSFSFLLVWLLSLFFIWFCFDISWKNALFFGSSGYIAQHFGHCVAMGIVGIFSLENDLLCRGIRMASLAITYVAFYFFFARRIRKGEYVALENRSLIAVSFLTVLMVYALNLWATNLNGHFNVVIRIYAAMCCIFLLCIQFGIFERSRLQLEKKEIESILQQQAKQLQISKDTMETINLFCHDVGRSLSRLSDSEADETEFSGLRKAIVNYQNEVKTGCDTLDVILTEKNLLCERYGIHFSYTVDGEKLSFLAPIDIYSIFENALNNAMESVVKTENVDARIISLSVCAKNEFLCIGVENFCAEAPLFENGLPVTTKGDTSLHGFGTRSIQYITEKYGGNLFMSAGNDMFYLKIIIPLPKQTISRQN